MLIPLRGALVLLVLFLAGCQPQDNKADFEYRGLALGTSFSIKVTKMPPGIQKENLKNKLDSLIDLVNQQMSTYIESSELSRFNQSRSTDWQPVSEDLVKVVKLALAVSEWSEGAFDVTVGPLVNLWGFGPDPRTQKAPLPDAITKAKSRIGYQFLEVRQAPPALRKRKADVYVDLSAIAKGYAVDKLAEYLDSIGVEGYLIEIGGELRLKGFSPRGEPWRIAIEKPKVNVRQIQKVLVLTDISLATSGDYRNYFEVNGQRFSHTIDSRSGRPISHRLASVTVLSHTTTQADALATALLVLGPERGWEKAAKAGIAALFIVKEKEGFSEKATRAFLSQTSEESS
ncbi:MAG TPA: FAD:protein FMN transferase [Methylothermaceae bacterium]|nr:FAD:protein FMN transferase [Methylothermaceae bacterium]